MNQNENSIFLSEIERLKKIEPKFEINSELEEMFVNLTDEEIKDFFQKQESGEFYNLLHSISGEVLSKLYSHLSDRSKHNFLENYENLEIRYDKEDIKYSQQEVIKLLKNIKEIEQSLVEIN